VTEINITNLHRWVNHSEKAGVGAGQIVLYPGHQSFKCTFGEYFSFSKWENLDYKPQRLFHAAYGRGRASE
jgi:hypothetical protein